MHAPASERSPPTSSRPRRPSTATSRARGSSGSSRRAYSHRRTSGGPVAAAPAQVALRRPTQSCRSWRRSSSPTGATRRSSASSSTPCRQGSVPSACRRSARAFGGELARSAHLRPARTLAAGAERMCEAVRALGFQASVVEVDDDRAVLATPTCPLRPLVRARPDAAEIDRGMWAGLAASGLTGVDVDRVECETQDCLVDHASCRVLISLRARGRGRPQTSTL